MRQSLRPDERLWVFFLGHANYDGEHAWFHLPGPDLREDEMGKLFAGLHCREQVFWMTTAESGRFVKDLSAKGRIVIAATRASGEDNETEFPTRLRRWQAPAGGVGRQQATANSRCWNSIIGSSPKCRLATPPTSGCSTEHAQLDDNGDGVGTERPLVAEPGEKNRPRRRRNAFALPPSCPIRARRRNKRNPNRRNRRHNIHSSGGSELPRRHARLKLRPLIAENPEPHPSTTRQ